uniref:AAA+ ATPase domain-containing protein n=1 Tax=Lotharella globosa TaxID=91324 RepID=A0A7S3YDC7_9EUKA
MCEVMDRHNLLRGRPLTGAEQLNYMKKAEKVKNKKGGGGGGGGSSAPSRKGERKMPFGSKGFSKAIRSAMTTGDWARAMQSFSSMIQRNAEPDMITAYALLTACIKGGSVPLPPEVSALLAKMAASPRNSNDRAPGKLRMLSHKEAFQLLQAMPQSIDSHAGARLAMDIIDATSFTSIAPGAKEYAKRKLNLLVLEFLEEAAVDRQRIESRDLQSLQRTGQAIADCRVERSMMKKKEHDVAFGRPHSGALEGRGMQKGDSVVISIMRERRMAMIEADVVGIGSRQVVVRFRASKEWDDMRERGSREYGGRAVSYRIDKMGNRMTHTRMIRAIEIITGDELGYGGGGNGKTLKNVVSPHPSLINAIVSPHEKLTGASLTAIEGSFTPALEGILKARVRHLNLNASQHYAVERALLQRVTLIQGPPGTGKTHVSVAIMEQWARLRKKVLAVAGTNIAVDNLVEGLVRKGVAVLRLGKPESIRPELERYTIDGLDLSSANGDKQAEYAIIASSLRNAEVICTTCSGAGSEMLARYFFPVVLCDEATQITEPENLIVLCRNAQQVVLVGDQCQLPPTVSSSEAEAGGLSTPLFTRLLRQGVKPCMLDTQYRMHPSIAEFPADIVYGGKLKNGIDAKERPIASSFPWPNKNIPVAIFPVQSQEERDGLSYYNAAEAEQVSWVLEQLLAAGFKVEEIGVITGYAAQVRHLRRMLRYKSSSALSSVEVSTVDGFQGREKEAIVFSAVRSNDTRHVGFLRDWRRVNVMLTRARRAMIVVGNINTLSTEHGTWIHWVWHSNPTNPSSTCFCTMFCKVSWARANGIVYGEGRSGVYDKQRAQTVGISRVEREATNMGSCLVSNIPEQKGANHDRKHAPAPESKGQALQHGYGGYDPQHTQQSAYTHSAQQTAYGAQQSAYSAYASAYGSQQSAYYNPYGIPQTASGAYGSQDPYSAQQAAYASQQAAYASQDPHGAQQPAYGYGGGQSYDYAAQGGQGYAYGYGSSSYGYEHDSSRKRRHGDEEAGSGEAGKKRRTSFTRER